MITKFSVKYLSQRIWKAQLFAPKADLCRGLHRSASCLRDKRGEKSKLIPQNEHKRIVYSVMPKEKCDTMAKFLTRHFHPKEPISVALGLGMEEIDRWFPQYLNASLFSSFTDVSIQAIDQVTNRRVGLLVSIIADPLLSKSPIAANFIDPLKHPISTQMFEFFGKVEEGMDPETGYGNFPNRCVKTLEIMFLATDPAYSCQGISGRMLGLCEALAATIVNCRVAYGVATSEYSYKALVRHGYQVVREVGYANYANSKGDKIFEGKMAKPHTKCRVLTKNLHNHFA